MKVAEVLVACDTHRIVKLEDGRCAFVCGAINSQVGDVLPQDTPHAEQFVEVFDEWAAKLIHAWGAK